MEAENQYNPEETWPYHFLLWAILERAIYDAIGQVTDIYTGTHLKREAELDAYYWIMNPPPKSNTYPQFTFPEICHHLNLSCETVRKTVKLAKEGEIDIFRQAGKRSRPGVTMNKLFG